MKIDYKNTTTYEMNALVGFPIVEYSTEWLTENGYLTPTKCFFIKSDFETEYHTEGYHDAYAVHITHNKERNNLIKDIVDNNKDKKILILTKLIEHGILLENKISGSILITSQTNKDLRKNKFQEYRENKFNILIGSAQIFSQGISVDNLDIIINAGANKSDIMTIQSIGRCMRKNENKEFAYYYDFMDENERYFRLASNQRQSILKDFGHEIVYVNDIKSVSL